MLLQLNKFKNVHLVKMCIFIKHKTKQHFHKNTQLSPSQPLHCDQS